MENIAELSTGRKLDELENYFQAYRDLPREIILKLDFLRVGHWFTVAALELVSQALVKSYRLFSYDLKSIRMPDTETTELTRKPRKPSRKTFLILNTPSVQCFTGLPRESRNCVPNRPEYMYETPVVSRSDNQLLHEPGTHNDSART